MKIPTYEYNGDVEKYYLSNVTQKIKNKYLKLL